MARINYQNKLLMIVYTGTSLASGPGLEPRLTGPKPVVLPLDDPELHLLQDYLLPSRQVLFIVSDFCVNLHLLHAILLISIKDTSKLPVSVN